ncbi:hypothetical protein AKL22_06030 [Carnobacterium maltaromaticum]|nr:hypothetical protein [Carnobacterium maltaromaticum]
MWRFLPHRNFIFFPKAWFKKTSLNKKFVEPFSSEKKIGKIDRTFFCPLEFLSFSRGVGSKELAYTDLIIP